MRRAAVYLAGAAAVLAAPAPAQAFWLFHPHSHWGKHVHHKYAVPLVALPQVVVGHPPANPGDPSHRNSQAAPPAAPPVSIAESTKAEIRGLGSDLDRLLEKTNKLGRGMVDPNSDKNAPRPFADIQKGNTAAGGGAVPKDDRGRGGPPGGPKDAGGHGDPPGG